MEVEAPAGYKLDQTPKTFTIYGGEKTGVNPVVVNVNNIKADQPTPTKTVNDGQALTLDKLNQEFTYKVSVPVTDINGVTSFVITDSVVGFLNITVHIASVTSVKNYFAIIIKIFVPKALYSR